MLLYSSKATRPKILKKINELDISHVDLWYGTFLNMHNVCRIFWMPCRDVLASGGPFLCIQNVYKDNCWIVTNVTMNYCVIFRYTTNTGHHRNIIYLKIPNESMFFEKLKLGFSRRAVWASRSPPSSARFQRKCIDCSNRDIIHTTAHTSFNRLSLGCVASPKR